MLTVIISTRPTSSSGLTRQIGCLFVGVEMFGMDGPESLNMIIVMNNKPQVVFPRTNQVRSINISAREEEPRWTNGG